MADQTARPPTAPRLPFSKAPCLQNHRRSPSLAAAIRELPAGVLCGDARLAQARNGNGACSKNPTVFLDAVVLITFEAMPTQIETAFDDSWVRGASASDGSTGIEVLSMSAAPRAFALRLGTATTELWLIARLCFGLYLPQAISTPTHLQYRPPIISSRKTGILQQILLRLFLSRLVRKYCPSSFPVRFSNAEVIKLHGPWQKSNVF
jgi:hypothetical protein